MNFRNEKFTILFLTIAFAGVMISLLYIYERFFLSSALVVMTEVLFHAQLFFFCPTEICLAGTFSLPANRRSSFAGICRFWLCSVWRKKHFLV